MEQGEQEQRDQQVLHKYMTELSCCYQGGMSEDDTVGVKEIVLLWLMVIWAVYGNWNFTDKPFEELCI